MGLVVLHFSRDFFMTRCPVDPRLQEALPPVRWDPHPSGRRSCPAPDLQVVVLICFDSTYYCQYCYYCFVIIVVSVVIVVSCRRCYWYCCYSNPNSLESAQESICVEASCWMWTIYPSVPKFYQSPTSGFQLTPGAHFPGCNNINGDLGI